VSARRRIGSAVSRANVARARRASEGAPAGAGSRQDAVRAWGGRFQGLCSSCTRRVVLNNSQMRPAEATPPLNAHAPSQKILGRLVDARSCPRLSRPCFFGRAKSNTSMCSSRADRRGAAYVGGAASVLTPIRHRALSLAHKARHTRPATIDQAGGGPAVRKVGDVVRAIESLADLHAAAGT
jgi:hypothetical protein